MKTWKVSDITNAKYLGLIEFQTRDEEFHNFDILQTETRLVFGGSTNTGFLESGYMEIDDCFSIDENLQALIEDLETYYEDGYKHCSDIVCTERM